MDQHLSLFKLLARSSILKVLAVLVLMVAAEVILFIRQAEKLAGQAGGFFLEDLFAESFFFVAFLAAFFAIAMLLYRTGSRPGSRQVYTLQRLGISQYAIIAWQSLWNLLCFLLLWAVQLWTVYLLLQNLLAKYPDAGFTQHSIFLVFWRHPTLHGLLPMADILVWIKNIVLLLAVSITTAYGSFIAYRTGKGSGIFIFMLIQTVNYFPSSVNDSLFHFIIAAITVILTLGLMFYMLYHKFELEPDEPEKEEKPCAES